MSLGVHKDSEGACKRSRDRSFIGKCIAERYFEYG